MDQAESTTTTVKKKKGGGWPYIILGFLLFYVSSQSTSDSLITDTIGAVGIVLFLWGLMKFGIGTNLFSRKKKEPTTPKVE